MSILPRLLLFRVPRGRIVAPSDFALGVLGAICIGIWLLLDWLASDPGSTLQPDSIPLLCWFVLGALIITWTLSRWTRPMLRYRTALSLVLLLLPLAMVGFWLIDSYAPATWTLFFEVLLGGYLLTCLARGAAACSGGQPLRPAIALAVVVAALIWMTLRLGINGAVWFPPDEDLTADAAAGTQADAVAAEELLFEQERRIDATLEKIPLSNGAAGPPHVYFLGFAGFGDQKVFAEEITYAARMADERYGSAARSLLLLNDRYDVDSAPLATVAGLRYALRGLAERMDPERDVLFLALSSHGSDDPALAVSNSGLPLAQLTDEALATALRESGIRWKVVVISACYAGGFLPALRDDHTVVITAAAADRTSFGCADDRTLTYFGEAFYRDSLTRTKTLREAFTETERLIKGREAEAKLTPSRPQAFFGAAMDRKLVDVEAGLPKKP